MFVHRIFSKLFHLVAGYHALLSYVSAAFWFHPNSFQQQQPHATTSTTKTILTTTTTPLTRSQLVPRTKDPISSISSRHAITISVFSSSSSPSSSSLKSSSSDGMSEDKESSSLDDGGVMDDCDEEGECEIDWSAMPGFENDEEEEENRDTTETEGDSLAPSSPVESDEDLTTTSASFVPSLDPAEEMSVLYDDFADLGYLNDCDEFVLDNDNAVNNERDDFRRQESVLRNLPPKPVDPVSPSLMAVTGVNPPVDQLRKRLEMQWQMREQTEECDVYQPVSCGGTACTLCHGTGSCPCRFCRGTGLIHMNLPGRDAGEWNSGNIASGTPVAPGESMLGGTLQSLLKDGPSSCFTSCIVCQQTGYELCKQCRGSGWIAEWTNPTMNSFPPTITP